MATLTVTASHDYSHETLSNITTIEFREPGQFDIAGRGGTRERSGWRSAESRAEA
jgi:hypothetical protein